MAARKSLRTAARLLLTIVPALALLTIAAPAQAQTAKVCLPVRATGVGQDYGPDSAGNLHTTATISIAGHVVGTTNATFTPSGPPAGTQLAFSGPIVFTPSASTATLTANVQGGVDLSTGTFTATSTSVSGSGLLAPITGRVTIRGSEDLASGAFTESNGGRLCVRAS